MSESVLNESQHEVDEEMSRRGFVRTAVVGVTLAYLAAIGYPVYRYLNSPVEKSAAMAAVKDVTLDKADQLMKGTALMFKFGIRPAMLTTRGWRSMRFARTWVARSRSIRPEWRLSAAAMGVSMMRKPEAMSRARRRDPLPNMRSKSMPAR